jgi:hypothetical protein
LLHRAGTLLAAIGCLAGATAAAAPLDVDVIPAWDGWSRPGRITEVEVRLGSRERESAQITVAADGDVVHAVVNLESGQPASLFIPVRAAELIAVEAGREGRAGRGPERRESRLAWSESPLLAWVASAPMPRSLAGYHAVAFDPGTLPHTAAAYSSIDALVIERRTLASLGQDQLAALLSFVAGCGRAILVSASPADDGLLRTAVGCGGRSFAAVASGSEVAGQLERILATPVAAPPAATTLAAINGPDLGAWYLAVTLLALCGAATVLAGIFATSIAVAVLVPALAALGVLGFVQSRPAGTQLTVWAETGPDDRLAQYRGLQQASVHRRGKVTIPVLAELSRPQSCRAVERIAWSWDATARRFSSVQFEGRLFASAALCYAGEFPVARSATVRGASSGPVALSNTGASAWPAGTLAWNGKLFPVAALGPGRDLVIVPGGGLQPANGGERAALARTPFDSQAILWPLDLRRVANAPVRSQAWLLLRVAPAAQG